MSLALCPCRCLRFYFLLCHGEGKASGNRVFGDPAVAGTAGLQRERDLRCLVSLEKVKGVCNNGSRFGSSAWCGEGCLSCCPWRLGSQNNGSFLLFMSKWWLGLEHALPATPSSFSRPSRFPPLSCVTNSKLGEMHPSPLSLALGHLFYWLSALPSLALSPRSQTNFP